MSAAERRRLRLGLLLSLLIHALLLSLTFGGEGFGLPGLSFPWEERRAEAPDLPDLRVVLTPAPQLDPQASEPRENDAPALAEAPPTSSAAPPEAQPPTISSAAPAKPSSELAPAAVLHAESPADIAAPAETARELIALTPAPSPDWIVRPPVAASAAAATPASAPSSPQANPLRADPVLDADAEARRLRAIEEAQDRALALARGEQAKQEAQQQAARAEAERAEAARQAVLAAQQEAARREAAQQETAAKAEAARLEVLKQEALKQEAARRSLAQMEAARAEAERQELARLQAALADTARAEAKRLEAARVAAAQQEAAEKEAAQREAARQDAMRQEAARAEAERQEAARAAAARQEAARQEAAARAEATQQEAARAEAARQESARQEAARQDAARAELARPDPIKEAAARREAALRAIGRQLDAEAARRDAASAAAASTSPRSSSLPLSVGSPRRGRLFGYDDANAELLLYAEAWARRITLNQTFEMAREAARQPHVDPLVIVAIRSDGSVESVNFVRSSGVPALDEAIRRIVRSQEHYAEFSPALAREYDVVEIRRTWQFDSAIRLY